MISEGRAVHARILRGVCLWAALWFRSQGPSWPCHFACPLLPTMGVLPCTGCLLPANCHRPALLPQSFDRKFRQNTNVWRTASSCSA